VIAELIVRLQDLPDLLKAKDLLHSSKRLFFIGNGGSAAIASHMAVDYCNNGKDAYSLNDGPVLTCIANDYGYERSFTHQLMWRQIKAGDTLVAVSSSGRSGNILQAAGFANLRGAGVLTLSGFDADNPLRALGRINLYVPSHDYGVVEVAHLAMLHSMAKP
jgi:D-sedoheptulose 7-phosphate isomerase